MDQIKIDNWVKENPGQPFPFWRHLPDFESRVLLQRLLDRIGMAPSTEPQVLLKWILESSVVCEGVDAECEGFNLMDVLGRSNIQLQSHVYLNWYRFDNIDIMSAEQLSEHFSYIWYPAADDLEVFDDSLAWMLLITHYGAVRLFRPRSGIAATAASPDPE